MPLARFASLQLARFESVRVTGGLDAEGWPGLLFGGVGADTRGAGTEPASQEAFVFAALGLHDDIASAERVLDDATGAAWLGEARERWCGVLQPFRHRGEANYFDDRQPGALFDAAAIAPADSGPFVSLTTVGWNTGDGFDMNRVRDFSTGALGVRVSMTAVPGLHSQHSFFFPRVLERDPFTVTFWRDDESIRGFAYGAGPHRRQIDRHRAQSLADRTSFTRLRVLRSAGTWYGADPLAFG